MAGRAASLTLKGAVQAGFIRVTRATLPAEIMHVCFT
jgi:hypothetical protein